MSIEKKVLLDGNEAAAYIAYKLSEVCAIYPITPSSSMGEWADTWSAQDKKNIWGTTPKVVEMQSEAGAAGAVHGSLQAGSLTTTFTASQGLLLMIPNMYKIAGELTPAVFHIAARSIASQALSIFGEHSDVMAARHTGFAMLCSNSVQEAMDLSLISHIATLKSRIPFMHFFDGFRTSHEVSKISQIEDDVILNMLDPMDVLAFRQRALTPDKPVIRGTAQNPDVFFQSREASNSFYLKTPAIVEEIMKEFKALTGREYQLFDYYGHPEADRIIIIMGSGSEAVSETIDYLLSKGEKVGVLKVRLYRPFSVEHFLKAIPKTLTHIAVLDRTKEPGSTGEPLYLDIVASISESFQNGNTQFKKFPKIIGGRYGLSSKEFTPGMIKAIYDEMKSDNPKNHFTIGINDDVTFTSLEYDHHFSIESKEVFRGIFWGLGSDGTVSANKNSIKIIGEETHNYAQGYFVYDSKKSGSTTTSYLRFGSKPIRSSYLIDKANFVACHQFQFLEKINVLEKADENAIFLLNAPYSKDEVWDHLPKEIQQTIIDKKLRFFIIDAIEVAKKTGMGRRVNTIMQTAFFAISGILPQEESILKIKKSIQKTFSKKGDKVVEQNYLAVDQTVENIFEVNVPSKVSSKLETPDVVSVLAPDFVKNVSAVMLAGKGDSLPVSQLPCDGTYPTGTTKWEKRNIASEIPVWDPNSCIQCGKCAMICPHAVVRIKVYEESILEKAPTSFRSTKVKGSEFPEKTNYTIQVAPEDCTGCELCVEICPAKNKEDTSLKAINMTPQLPIKEQEKENWDFFSQIPNFDRNLVKKNTIKGSQLLEPLFEFSGACAGCGETPYIKMVTQLFGDRMLIANATGCSSIYGGNLPTTPYTTNSDGRGPAWSNSLFEDNAEFGLGFRLSIDKKQEQARELIYKYRDEIGPEIVDQTLRATQKDEADIYEQRERVDKIRKSILSSTIIDKDYILSLVDYLVKKSVWIFGGDGWAYDIGYGGLDHVLASGKNVNILVLDTEVYSNTGGQMSKSTPMGAVAKFAANGRPLGKKDLGLLAMSYGHVYVGKIAMGANDTHTLKTLLEAEKYDGPSLIIAYSPCIAHGYNMKYMASQQKLAVESGHWHLYRYHPEKSEVGENPFEMDSRSPRKTLNEYMSQEMRFNVLHKIDPERAKELTTKAQQQANDKFNQYNRLAQMTFGDKKHEE
ncbi:MAG: pyruvate:ferredoxin (flavodoxin) oxidoreductase [Halobacteriovoraceae bacterium]|nr:pyruvate:ferredoxin (flavodoxin) oxidoreductase [Halobacteriovoraceae bacterium]